MGSQTKSGGPPKCRSVVRCHWINIVFYFSPIQWWRLIAGRRPLSVTSCHGVIEPAAAKKAEPFSTFFVAVGRVFSASFKWMRKPAVSPDHLICLNTASLNLCLTTYFQNSYSFSRQNLTCGKPLEFETGNALRLLVHTHRWHPG